MNVISLWFTCLVLVSYYWITVIKGCSGQQAGNEAATGDKRGFGGKYSKGSSGNSKMFLLQKHLWACFQWGWQPWFSLVSCFIPKALQGWSWGCTLSCLCWASSSRMGLTGEHWELMSFRQTLAGGFVALICLQSGFRWWNKLAFCKVLFESPEANVTSKDAKCKYSWKGWRFTLPMAWEWVHDN